MSSTLIENAETAEGTQPRVFWKSDWSRASAMLRQARHLRCSSEPKPAAHQAVIDLLAAEVAQVFAADAEGATVEPFDLDSFLSGTQLAGLAAVPDVLLDSPPDSTDDEEADDDTAEDTEA